MSGGPEHISPCLVLGIDEAGRGPGLGPMVLAGVAVDRRQTTRLRRAGVKDSKAFGSGSAARQERARLAELVRQHATWVSVEICQVAEIDEHVARGGLNELERARARQLIRRAPACGRIVADGRGLFAALAAEFAGLEAVDRAESFHLAVAAASLCAKALRDELFAAVAARYQPDYGELAGGGYMNEGTRAFVARYVERHGCLPPEARKTWPWRGIVIPEAASDPTP
jgi:ribonuclease HII